MADLKDLKETYEESINKNVWKNHATWKCNGVNVPCTNIVDFWKSTGLAAFNGITTVDEYYKVIDKMAKVYTDYCQSVSLINGQKVNWTNEDIIDLSNNFKGYMGEYFFIELFLNQFKGSLLIKNRNYSDYFLRTYYHAAPLHEVKDFGIDGTCVDDTGKNCVIQVKFWNRYDPHLNLKMDVVQKAFCEGVVHNYIDPYETDNVIICWLGTNDKVSKYLKEDAALEKHVVFVDHNVIKKSLDNNIMFWTNNFVNGMNTLMNM